MDPIVICGYIYMDVYTQYVGVGKLPISVGDNSDLEYIFRCVFFFWLLSTPLVRWRLAWWFHLRLHPTKAKSHYVAPSAA